MSTRLPVALGKIPMSSNGLPEPLRSFLAYHFKSVEQLEVLMLLRATAHRQWTAAEVCAELRSSVGSIEGRLTDLAARGFLSELDAGADRSYRYAPAAEDTRRLLDQVASTYKERRLAVISLIYEEPESSAVSFAEAFKIKRRE